VYKLLEKIDEEYKKSDKQKYLDDENIEENDGDDDTKYNVRSFSSLLFAAILYENVNNTKNVNHFFNMVKVEDFKRENLVLSEEKLTDDKIKAVKDMENTPEGKKLKAEYVSALQEMKKMSIEETMAEARSVKIDSIKIDGNTARMVFTVTVDGVLEYNVWDLVKVDGRWLLKKTRSSKSSAIIER
jgi:hypothetical protein